MDALTAAAVMTPDPISVHATDTVERVEREMRLAQISHIPVVDDRRVLVGLVTQGDLLGAREPARRVADVMRTDVKVVAPDTPAHEAAYLLLRFKIGCVPVTNSEGHLIGIVTEHDFVRLAHVLLGGRVPSDQLELEEHEASRV